MLHSHLSTPPESRKLAPTVRQLYPLNIVDIRLDTSRVPIPEDDRDSKHRDCIECIQRPFMRQGIPIVTLHILHDSKY